MHLLLFLLFSSLPPISITWIHHMKESLECKKERITLRKVLCRKFNIKFQFLKGHHSSNPLVLTDKWDVHSEIKP